MDLLKNIHRAVDSVLAGGGIELSIDDKAEAVALLYELHSGTGKRVEEGMVKRYLKLVA